MMEKFPTVQLRFFLKNLDNKHLGQGVVKVHHTSVLVDVELGVLLIDGSAERVGTGVLNKLLQPATCNTIFAEKR